MARKLVERLANRPVAFLDQDSYYKDLSDLSMDERREVNFDYPDAFDTDLLVAHLKALRERKAVEKPVYSFTESVRTGATVRVEPGALVVVEGILVLAIDAIRKELDIRLFVDAEDDVRMIRRLTRDIKERGRDFDHIVAQYFKSVRPMHYGFVEPSKRHADIIIPHGGNNDIAIDMMVGVVNERLGHAS